jgi:hypothetical protein
MDSTAAAGTGDLRRELEKLRGELISAAPADVVAAFAKATEELVSSGLVDQTLHVGDHAPAFTLPDSTGRPYRLADNLSRGPLVLTFYRGAW